MWQSAQFDRQWQDSSVGKPNPPYNISINCEVSRGTAIVNWTPGFDGGAEQTFIVSYRTSDGDQQLSVKFRQPNAIITGLKDGTLYYFKVIAINTNGKTLSEEEESCKTQEVVIIKESNIGGIIGGTLGGVVLIILIVLIFLNRKYQIKCHERMPNSSGAKMNASDSLSRLPGLGAEMSAQYEELNQNRREQENSYDAIRTPNKNRISGKVVLRVNFNNDAQYEELNQNRREQENGYAAVRTPNNLQPQKEESKYEITSPKDSDFAVFNAHIKKMIDK
ncbi:uncharacterized protein LOC134270506 [Saccostrea cucullata]|uniref:uncharacterized protein LOC134270506 n=1 Tax=Saccostrea cuccullata TaxID=36930 RepID=UPI002ECFFC38